MPSPLYRMLAVALPMAIWPMAQAVAESNVLSIVQDGGENRLTVDQSQASNSQVGGLEIGAPTLQTFSLTPNAETSQSEDSLPEQVRLNVLSAERMSGRPARQMGGGNSADIKISGNGGFVGLLQSSASPNLGNQANVNLAGGGQALIGQLGGGNKATAMLGAGALEGTILQKGDSNVADLSVTGKGSSGSISQYGSGLNNSLAVSGAGTSAALISNGVSNGTAGTPITVQSNGASVTITQSKM
ncbi:hypothetical protein [Aureimonas sp. AU40]|uniref:hypothetical protein n=1 Tax=Aureimonas sp. AU40 TaxID=1637747 RepID=UPI000A870C31|nr:hypothetical protein [Aureimonas sp. AU40]